MPRPDQTTFIDKVRRVQTAVIAARGADRRHFNISGEVAPGMRLVLSEVGGKRLYGGPQPVLAQPDQPRSLLCAVRPREPAPDPRRAAPARAGARDAPGGRLSGRVTTVTHGSKCVPAARRPRPAPAGARPRRFLPG